MFSINNLYLLLVVCIGASIGSVLRWLIYSAVEEKLHDTFAATLIVNLLGSFIIGIFYVLFKEIHSPVLRVLMMTGVLASFTTFSTFSLDALRLLTQGQIMAASMHIITQVVLGVSFCYLGVKIGQKLFV